MTADKKIVKNGFSEFMLKALIYVLQNSSELFMNQIAFLKKYS